MNTTPTTQEITVIVAGQERRFNLRPFTIRQALEHIKSTEKAWNTAREATKDATGDPLELTLNSRAYLEAVCPTVVALLSEPADGGAPLTDEEFWSLDSREPVAVIAAQQDFAQLGSIVANAQRLIEERQRQVLSEAVAASEALLSQVRNQVEA